MFKVAIIGRPNVGKSTLFNLLSKKKLALTSDTPGLTRDRKEYHVSLYDIDFVLIDTGGYETSKQVNIINQAIWQQAQEAIESAHCILFLVDSSQELTTVDRELTQILRCFSKPIILCLNKSDVKLSKIYQASFYELGLDDICITSFVHKVGLLDLYSSIKVHYVEYLKNHNSAIQEQSVAEVDKSHKMTLLFAGKPNVGKSTLVNNLLHEERLIATDVPGTTRDAIYLDFQYKDYALQLVDTAGLRRRTKVLDDVEKLANKSTIQGIILANIVVLMIACENGLTKQDLILAQQIIKEGRGLIIVVNKIDQVDNKTKYLQAISDKIEQEINEIKKPYVIGVSALLDPDLSIILDTAIELYQKWQMHYNTSMLNKWLASTISRVSLPLVNGRRLKIKYITQIKTRPITIQLWSNCDKKSFPRNYLIYLHSQFCRYFNQYGNTIRWQIHKSDNPYHK